MKSASTWKPWSIDAVGISGLVIMTLLAVIFGFKPIIAQRLDRSDQQQELTHQRELLQSLTETTTSIDKHLTRVEQAISQSELRLEPARQLNRRVAALAELAGNCGLNVDEIQPGKAVSSERYELIPIELAGRAAYVECAAFLHELAQRFPDMTVATMQLEATGGNAQRVARFRITLAWHAAPMLTASADSSGGGG